MTFVIEASDMLLALLQDRGHQDPTFQRMVRTYAEVADLLGCRADYERSLASVLAAEPGASMARPVVPRGGDHAVP